MDFYELVNKRRMVRNFTDEPVSAEAIDRILDAARHGPSAGFTQGQDFIVVTDLAMRRKLAQICGEKEYTDSGFDPVHLQSPGADRALHQRSRLSPPLPAAR